MRERAQKMKIGELPSDVRQQMLSKIETLKGAMRECDAYLDLYVVGDVTALKTIAMVLRTAMVLEQGGEEIAKIQRGRDA